MVFGAPALKGYSANVMDLPGSACSAMFGVLPWSPYGSMYAEIYARGNCPETHIGYHNTNQAQAAISEGIEVRIADDLVLPEDCLLVAYDVSFKRAVNSRNRDRNL